MDEEEKNDLPDPEALEVGEIEAATDRTLSHTRLLLKRFFRSKLSVAGLIMLIVLFVFSFIGPTLTFLPFIWPEQQSDYSNAVTEENATPVTMTDAEGQTFTVWVVVISEPTNSRRRGSICSAPTTRDTISFRG